MGESDHNINIKTETEYVSDQSSPREGYYVFAYTITLTNEGHIPATLLKRRWLITDANCNVQEVRGDGVVGEQPYIKPGESFKYKSAAILTTPVGCMQGSYGMIGDDGVEFNAPVPVFSLSIPNTIH